MLKQAYAKAATLDRNQNQAQLFGLSIKKNAGI